MTTLTDIRMSMTNFPQVSPHQEGFIETLATCPLCSGTSFRRLATPGHWIGEELFSPGASALGLQRCQSCSLAFVNPRPSRALLSAFYDCDSYVCHSSEAGSTATAQFLLECVERHGPYGGKQILDFGCGGGFLLRAARDKQWSATGFDIGRRALASCHAQGLNATSDLAELTSSRFDVIFLNHVFEHIADQQGVLSYCRQRLGEKGKLFIVVPNLAGMRARLSLPLLSRRFNVDERHRAFPIHLFYFTPRTLSHTLEKNGFRVASVETFGMGLDEYLNRPDVKPNGSVKETGTKKNHVLRHFIKKGFFSAGLGENLLAVAQPA